MCSVSFHFIWSFVKVFILVNILLFKNLNRINCLLLFHRVSIQIRNNKMISRRQNPRSRGRVRNEQENRSILLQDFLSGRYPNIQLNDIVSHVCEFARDRDGSKLIQLKLDETTDHRNSIFDEMKPNLFPLMADRFANFIVQKFIEIGNAEQRQEIFTLIQLHFMELSRHKYGCRVVQRAIERSTIYHQHVILQQFSGSNIILLAQDPHGNHVVQTCFRSVMDFVQVI